MTWRAILWKDARREWRGKEAAQAGLVLVALFFVLFAFAFQGALPDARAAAALVWAPIVFGAAAVAGRGLAVEADRGTIELLRSAPVPLVAHGVSRTIIDLAVGALLGAATLAFAWAFLGVAPTTSLAAILALAVLGIGIVASLLGALASQARARELLLPILMVPLLAPLLLAGLHATLAQIDGTGDLRVPLLMMIGYDLVMAGLAWIAWPFVLEAD